MSNPWLKIATPPQRISAGHAALQQRADAANRPTAGAGLHPAAREIFSLWASGFTAAAMQGERRRR